MRISIPKSRLSIRFSRSGGPGGQNVNKVETKVEIRLALSDLDVPHQVRERIAARLQGRTNALGEIAVSSSRFRVRSRNLKDALERLTSLLEDAARPPVPRIATRPTRSSERRRIEGKRRDSLRKRDRRRPEED
jgi:ribosome-associated protein